MRRFLDYYRQFEELPPEEVSRGFREQSQAARARALESVPTLDLASPAWHEPPHAEIINAATFALRRAVNAYPEPEAAHAALAGRHGVAPDRVVAGHGAGELLRAACHALLAGSGGEVLIAWPGWGPLPRLVQAAGGTAHPVPLDSGGVPDVDALLAAAGPRTRAVALASPNDPTGGTIGADELRRLAAGLGEHAWILLDAALADFEPPEADLAPLTDELERVLVVRSFSKAHAMAGFRAGYVVASPGARELLARLTPAFGASAPALAGMTWAAEYGERVLPRRRALAAAERERLAGALGGTSFSFPAGTGPLVWLESSRHDGPAIASHLATARIFVTPGTAWGDERHVRVTLRGPAATGRLADALRELG
jgi:histidinol-phosphate/aromatic aminotransferase/cobyric acid decarboxylase-like protein